MPAGDLEECYDFDTGAGNIFNDSAVRYPTKGELEYDKDGATGANGKVDQAIVNEILQQPCFVHDIPKTAGRETLGHRTGEEICERMLSKGVSPEDCVATITRITAQLSFERYLDEIYMGGVGGGYNPSIVNYLKE